MKPEEAFAMRLQGNLLETLDGILQDFHVRARGVKGIVVADANGLPLASSLPGEHDVSVIAAMSVLVTESANSVFNNLQYSAEVIVIEGKEANIAAMALPGGLGSILAILDKQANIGLAKIELKRAAQLVAGAFGQGGGSRPRIIELFILYEGGMLIRHYSDTLRTDFDRDILGGMLSAIQAFVRETMASSAGALDVLRYGNRSICFVRGTSAIAAVVTDGDCEAVRYVVFDALKDFEEKYEAPLKAWDGSVRAFPGIDDCFAKVLRP